MRKVQNQKEMKLNNLVNILDYLKKNDIAVKSVLARELGLSVVTITKICDDLTEAGILEYTSERESTGGRKPVGIRLIPDSRMILALDLSEKGQAYLGLMNLAYEEMASDIFQISDRWSLEDFLQALKGKLKALQESVPRGTVLGMSVSVPAIFNQQSGIIEECNNPLFLNRDLVRELSQIFDGKIIMENDANLAALGHYHETGDEDLLYIHFTEGVGLGIILKGCIHRGFAGYAGELANVGVPDFMGHWSTVEKVLSKEYLTACYEDLKGMKKDCSSLDEFKKAIHQDAGDLEAIADFIKETIGRISAMIIDLFNPQKVIMGGRTYIDFHTYLPGITKYAQEFSMTLKRIPVQISDTVDDRNLVITGCCEQFYQYWIQEDQII